MNVKMAKVDDKVFILACQLAGVAATHRQWCKWRRGDGSARKFAREATLQVNTGN